MHIVRIIYWSGMGQNGPKMRIFAQMTKFANFGPKFAVFGPKILILSGESKSLGTNVTEKPPTHLVRIVFWSGMGPNGHIMEKPPGQLV